MFNNLYEVLVLEIKKSVMMYLYGSTKVNSTLVNYALQELNK